jgi:hypothetical protein
MIDSILHRIVCLMIFIRIKVERSKSFVFEKRFRCFGRPFISNKRSIDNWKNILNLDFPLAILAFPEYEVKCSNEQVSMVIV